MTSRTAEERRSSRRRQTAETADAHAVRVSPSEPDPTDDYDVIDFWGSGDSLTCLANWG